MGLPEDMSVHLLVLKEVLDDLNVTYKANEKKADLIEKVRHVRATLQEESYCHSERANVFSSPEYTDTKLDNCFNFKKSPDVCLLFYDDQKEHLQATSPFPHTISFGNYWNIYTWKFSFSSKIIMSSIIVPVIFATVSNKLCMLTAFIKLLCAWMALIFSWLVAQVNFMSVLGENIVQI